MRPSRLLPAVAVLGALASAAPAQAVDTYDISRTDDTSRTVCSSSDLGNCTLRTALNRAVGRDVPAVIRLEPGTYELRDYLSVFDTNGGAITIRGRGAGGTSITRNGGPSEVVNLAGGDLTLEGVTVTGGANPGRGGGGITGTGGSLTVSDVRVTGNAATDFLASGGGISFTGDTLTVQRSVVDRNTAGNGTAGSGQGGGISTGAGGKTTIRNSVLSGNRADGSGSGLFGIGGPVAVDQSTVSGNVGSPALAGGAQLITLVRSVVDQGQAGCSGMAVTDGGSNVDAGSSCARAASSKADTAPRLATDLLRPVPLPGSPAMDTVDRAACASTDDLRGAQRRPIDGNFDGIAACDAGAVEYTPNVPVLVEAGADVTDAAVAVDTVGGDAEQTVRVEYGTDTTYGATTDALVVPAGQEARRSTISIPGLAPATTYHLRLVGSDGVSTSRGADRTVTTRPAPAAPATGGVAGQTDTGGGTTTPPAPAAKRFTVKLGTTGKLDLKRLPKRGLALRVTCSAACRFTAELRVSKAVAKRLGIKRTILASARGTGTAAKAKTVRVKLPRGLARKLRSGKVAWAAVRVAAKPTAGGRTRTVTGAVTLKR